MSLIAIAAKKIFTPLKVIDDGLLVIEDQVIRSVGSRQDTAVPEGARLVDLGGRILCPGFVEIHIHGGGGRDLMEATPEALETVARMVLKHGTTSFLPTTLTAPVPELLKSLAGLGAMIQSWKTTKHSGNGCLAEPLGIHMEGPFLSGARRGVHPQKDLQNPSPQLFRQFAEAAAGTVKILTLAPEMEGAMELQASAMQRGVKVALGHSDATFGETEKAIEAGASHGVHTFNAMRPFEHRETGILGAILTDDRVHAEVIADGVHVSPPALRLLLAAKSASRIVLVTDGVSAGGMGPGCYRLGEVEVVVKQESPGGPLVSRNSEGKLAGSVLTQDLAVHNMVAFTGVTLCEAVRMASWNPARILGMEERKGWLRPGADADLVVLEADGTVAGSIVRGAGSFL